MSTIINKYVETQGLKEQKQREWEDTIQPEKKVKD